MHNWNYERLTYLTLALNLNAVVRHCAKSMMRLDNHVMSVLYDTRFFLFSFRGIVKLLSQANPEADQTAMAMCQLHHLFIMIPQLLRSDRTAGYHDVPNWHFSRWFCAYHLNVSYRASSWILSTWELLAWDSAWVLAWIFLSNLGPVLYLLSIYLVLYWTSADLFGYSSIFAGFLMYISEINNYSLVSLYIFPNFCFAIQITEHVFII